MSWFFRRSDTEAFLKSVMEKCFLRIYSSPMVTYTISSFLLKIQHHLWKGETVFFLFFFKQINQVQQI